MSYAVVVQELPAEWRKRDDKLSKLVDEALERRYRERGFAYFIHLLRNMRLVDPQELENEMEQFLSDEEFEDLAMLDLMIRGYVRACPDTREVWLAVEVLSTVDQNDVERAERRAGLLRKLGYPAIPVVAGNKITEGGSALVEAYQVLLVQNGRKQYVEEALAKALE